MAEEPQRRSWICVRSQPSSSLRRACDFLSVLMRTRSSAFQFQVWRSEWVEID
jgi:hypothetical protein